jgi:general secretion pathway protein B
VSLILDALRRADSERERGAVPGLHAQPVPVASADAPRAARATPWQWIALAAGALLLAVLAWVIAGREAPRQAAVPAAAPPVAAASGSPPAPQPSAAAAPVPAVAPPLRAGQAEPQPVAEPAPWPAPDSSRKAPAEEVAAAPAARAPEARKVPSAAAVPSEAPITPREQLPENIRSQLPPLAVGGSIYSSNAADRSLIVDGRILRENDRLNADLTLEQIRPRTAVLRFKGYRFEIGF